MVCGVFNLVFEAVDFVHVVEQHAQHGLLEVVGGDPLPPAEDPVDHGVDQASVKGWDVGHGGRGKGGKGGVGHVLLGVAVLGTKAVA